MNGVGADGMPHASSQPQSILSNYTKGANLSQLADQANNRKRSHINYFRKDHAELIEDRGFAHPNGQHGFPFQPPPGHASTHDSLQPPLHPLAEETQLQSYDSEQGPQARLKVECWRLRRKIWSFTNVKRQGFVID